MAIHARLRDALAALINDLACESPAIVVTDYGFGMLLGSASQDELAGAMNEILGNKLGGSVAITAADAVDITDPRNGVFYFKYGPVPGTVLEETMAPEYFSLSSNEVTLHTAASAEEVAKRREDLESFKRRVGCITSGERRSEQLRAQLLEKVRALIVVAVRTRDHLHYGLEHCLEDAACIAGIDDYHQLTRHLDDLDLPTLCAVVLALGEEDTLDNI